jgi:hypothetical protein
MQCASHGFGSFAHRIVASPSDEMCRYDMVNSHGTARSSVTRGR